MKLNAKSIFRVAYAVRPLRILLIVFGVVYLIIGIVLTVDLIYEYEMVTESLISPIVSGQIIESYNSYSSKGNIIPHVRYVYRVDGIEHTATRIAWNGTLAQSSLDAPLHFPRGSSVMVHYLPRDPNLACIEIGNISLLGVRLYEAIACFLVSVILYIFMSKQHKSFSAQK